MQLIKNWVFVFFVFFSFFVLSNSSNASFCFQQFANVSTACGGLDNGTYSVTTTGSWTNQQNMLDGDYSTCGYVASGTGQIDTVFIKPPLAQGLYAWEKSNLSNQKYNLTNANSCFGAISDRVNLTWFVDNGITQAYQRCWNGSGYVNLFNEQNINVCEFGGIYWIMGDSVSTFQEIRVYNIANSSFVIDFNITVSNGSNNFSQVVTNGSAYFQNLSGSYNIDTYFNGFDVRRDVYVFDANDNASITVTVSLISGLCIDSNFKFCSNPYYLNGYYYCDIDDIYDCLACNELQYRNNITFDTCNATTCQDTCTDYGNRSCYSSTLVQSCTLQSNGCYSQYIVATCTSGDTCYRGYCYSTVELNQILYNNYTNYTIPDYDTGEISNRLNSGSKILIILMFMVLFGFIGFILGASTGINGLGIIFGSIFSLGLFIIASIPNFPVIGGYIPIWLSIIIIVLIAIVLSIVSPKFIQGGGLNA